MYPCRTCPKVNYINQACCVQNPKEHSNNTKSQLTSFIVLHRTRGDKKTNLIQCVNSWVKINVIFNHKAACNKSQFLLLIRRFKQCALFHTLSVIPTFRNGQDYSVFFQSKHKTFGRGTFLWQCHRTRDRTTTPVHCVPNYTSLAGLLNLQLN